MNLSKYLKSWPSSERPDYRLFFSTKKGSTSFISNDTYSLIANRDIPDQDKEALLKLGIVVPVNLDEKEDIAGIIDRMNENNPGINVSVILNLDCNFSCTYCYEEGLKGKHYMSQDTVESLVAFIKNRFTAGKKLLNIDFYGGEPLLSTNIIKKISNELQPFVQERGGTYTFTLVTNGSLFTRRTAIELKGLGLQSIKTTLDGPPQIHNSRRPFKGGKPSFDAIIRNIKETWDVVKIGIGGNFQKESYQAFTGLLDDLEREGLSPEKIYSIKFDPVMKQLTSSGAAADFTEGCMSVNEPWLIEASLMLREEVLKRGYSTPKIMPMPCQVEMTDAFVVNYDGAIYKCPAFIGREGFKIGALREGITDYRVSHNLGMWKNEECLDCGYLPLCFGGCRYMAYARDGKIDKPDCKKPYLDAALEALIKQDVKYMRPQKQS